MVPEGFHTAIYHVTGCTDGGIRPPRDDTTNRAVYARVYDQDFRVVVPQYILVKGHYRPTETENY